jgi:hypothetical protein
MTLYQAFDLDSYTSREYPHVLYRHAVRKWYRDKGYTYRMIADLEFETTGICPHRSTLIHSCRQAEETHCERVRAQVASKADLLRIDG